MPIPVEAFTGSDFAQLLLKNNFTVDHVKKLLEPKEALSIKPTIAAGSSPSTTPDVTVRRVGSVDPTEIL